MNQSNDNPYDQLSGVITSPEEIEKLQKDNESKYNRIDYLVHQTFSQTDSGKELLELWREDALMLPSCRGGIDMISVGLNEGRKQFVRDILTTIRRVEND